MDLLKWAKIQGAETFQLLKMLVSATIGVFLTLLGWGQKFSRWDKNKSKRINCCTSIVLLCFKPFLHTALKRQSDIVADICACHLYGVLKAKKLKLLVCEPTIISYLI